MKADMQSFKPSTNELCGLEYRQVFFAQNAFGRLVVTNNEQVSFQLSEAFSERLIYVSTLFIFAATGSMNGALDIYRGSSLAGSIPIYCADPAAVNTKAASLITIGQRFSVIPFFQGNDNSSIQFATKGSDPIFGTSAPAIGTQIMSPFHLNGDFDNVRFRIISADNNITSGTIAIAVLSRNPKPSIYGNYPY